MKNKLILIIIIITTCRLLYAAPIAGVSSISGNTDRASALALIFEQHILDILKKNSFSTIQPDIINRELTRFNCVEEKCILKFAEDADIDIIISGTITDKKNSIVIKLQAYGIYSPFNKRIINQYEVKLPLDVNINSREFSLIGEEHSAEFISKTLDVFIHPLKIKASGDKYILEDNTKISGVYKVYRKNKYDMFQLAGEADISDGVLLPAGIKFDAGENYILFSYKDKSREIGEYYRSRKREIVFEKSSFYDTMFMLAITPAASATMPFSSLFLGYYMNNDWTGAGLWMFNAPPYLYIEARGLINSPKKIKSRYEDISRDDRAMNYFAWYMLCAGGMPLFVDSYTADYLHKASYFTGNNELLGNTATAVMLSLVSNGGGHFYRGSRSRGYFYFHLNNILLYMTIREFSAPEKYDEVSGIYTKKNTNRTRGLTLGSIFILSKTVEVIHAIIGKENLSSGEVIEEYAIPEPVFTLDQNGMPVFGLNAVLKF